MENVIRGPVRSRMSIILSNCLKSASHFLGNWKALLQLDLLGNRTRLFILRDYVLSVTTSANHGHLRKGTPLVFKSRHTGGSPILMPFGSCSFAIYLVVCYNTLLAPDRKAYIGVKVDRMGLGKCPRQRNRALDVASLFLSRDLDCFLG